MTLAMIVFFAALAGVIALFSLKFWEERRGRILAERSRARADEMALGLKDRLDDARAHAERIPPEVAHLSRKAVHAAALGTVGVARGMEKQALRVADLVSAKRGFERRETKSEFLKQVTEYKNGSEELEQ